MNTKLNKEDIFFSILSCKDFISTRQKHLKSSWVQNIKYMFASDITTEDNVMLTTQTGHISAEIKQLESLNYILKNHANFEWYFFCDDDTFVNVENLINYLNSLPEHISNIGKVLSSETDPMNPTWKAFNKGFKYYSGGAGFAIRKDLLTKLSCKKLYITTKYSDVSMGLLLADESLHDCNLLNCNIPVVENHTIEQIKKSITYHYVKDDLMCSLGEITKCTIS